MDVGRMSLPRIQVTIIFNTRKRGFQSVLENRILRTITFLFYIFNFREVVFFYSFELVFYLLFKAL